MTNIRITKLTTLVYKKYVNGVRVNNNEYVSANLHVFAFIAEICVG